MQEQQDPTTEFKNMVWTNITTPKNTIVVEKTFCSQTNQSNKHNPTHKNKTNKTNKANKIKEEKTN